jgi:hypothetical protein
MKNKVSPEVQEKAMKVAKGTQKSGQTKEQTKLIAQGIEKGIAEYKKQQKTKLREQDKQRKQKLKQQDKPTYEAVDETANNSQVSLLPWVLLILSWLAFIGYHFI